MRRANCGHPWVRSRASKRWRVSTSSARRRAISVLSHCGGPPLHWPTVAGGTGQEHVQAHPKFITGTAGGFGKVEQETFDGGAL